jgi:hypothetical protein
MLVLRKTHASSLAQPHTPPAGVITTGESSSKIYKQKIKQLNSNRCWS